MSKSDRTRWAELRELEEMLSQLMSSALKLPRDSCGATNRAPPTVDIFKAAISRASRDFDQYRSLALR
jgi:hypothetical protein